jgi:hypothetical protein
LAYNPAQAAAAKSGVTKRHLNAYRVFDQLGGEAMGVITRVAGTGTRGSGVGGEGDDGLATEAELNTPFYVAVTADRGFLIADLDSYVVRKVASI